MADVRISDMSAATAANDGMLVEVSDGGTTRSLSIANLKAWFNATFPTIAQVNAGLAQCAALAGATFTGLVRGVAPVGDDSSSAFATTSWVLGQLAPPLATPTPLMDGTAAAGAATRAARADHVHPTDATRLAKSANLSDVASPSLALAALGGVSTIALAAGLATVAQQDDVRQLMIRLAKLEGKASGYLAGAADDFADQSGVDGDGTTIALLHFDGANGATATTDDRGHTVTLGGNAKLSTAQSAFGGSSLLLDGTAGTQAAMTSADFAGLVTGAAWTLEGSFYPANATQKAALFNVSAGGAQQSIDVYQNGTSLVVDNGVTSGVSVANAFAAGAKTKVEVSCDAASNLRVFVNGTLASTTTAQNYGAAPNQVLVGGYGGVGGLTTFSGYVDEVRISNVVRHTASYSVETSAFYSGSSTGVTYDGTNKLFTNLAGVETAQSFPAMTGNSAPSGYTATASSTLSTNYPYLAFDQVGNTSSQWAGNTASNEWLQRVGPAAVTIARYQIGSGGSGAPQAWTLYGTNDGGTTLVALDTQSGQTGWASYETRTFTIPGALAAYSGYRLLVTSNNGYSSIVVSELILLKQLPPSALDLRSIAFQASAVPSKASLFVLAKALNGGTITPGTNLIGLVSRNGGATYTPVTLAAAGALSSGFQAYEANGQDVTGQSSGQSMKWRLQTAGGLAVQVQAVVEQWG